MDNATLTRFFSLHFLVPFLVMAFSAIHLVFLHKTGSRNPLGVERDLDKIFFNPYFIVKDLIGVFRIIFLLLGVSFISP